MVGNWDVSGHDAYVLGEKGFEVVVELLDVLACALLGVDAVQAEGGKVKVEGGLWVLRGLFEALEMKGLVRAELEGIVGIV